VGLLDGKTILVTGIANRWSIASGIARRLHEHGAKLILTYQGDRVEDAVRKHGDEFGGAPVFECDVTNDDSLRALAAAVGKIDGLVHSIAYVKKEDLSGKVYTTSRDGFAMAMEISAYSLIALVGALVENLNDGASVMALTYLGATQIVPN
jgi:enoyl-[acyl-carrier protein] reductase I